MRHPYFTPRYAELRERLLPILTSGRLPIGRLSKRVTGYRLSDVEKLIDAYQKRGQQ